MVQILGKGANLAAIGAAALVTFGWYVNVLITTAFRKASETQVAKLDAPDAKLDARLAKMDALNAKVGAIVVISLGAVVGAVLVALLVIVRGYGA